MVSAKSSFHHESVGRWGGGLTKIPASVGRRYVMQHWLKVDGTQHMGGAVHPGEGL